MVRSIGGLLDRLAPAMQRALFLHLGLPYPSTDDDPPTKQLKETLKTAFSTANAAFIRTSDALLADLNILASPIGETYVAQELTTSEPPVGDLFPRTLEGEHDRALWLIINDPIAAAEIIAVASFDSRFEKPAHWAGVRIPNARPGFWDELSDENVLKGVFERSRAKGTVPPTRLGVEYHSRRALRHAGQTIQATLSEGGKRETPILTGADGKHKRTPIQHTRQFHVVIDADQETFDVVSLDLAKGVRTKLFQDPARPDTRLSLLAIQARVRARRADQPHHFPKRRWRTGVEYDRRRPPARKGRMEQVVRADTPRAAFREGDRRNARIRFRRRPERRQKVIKAFAVHGGRRIPVPGVARVPEAAGLAPSHGVGVARW